MFLFNCTAALCRGSQPAPSASAKAEWNLVKRDSASSLPINRSDGSRFTFGPHTRLPALLLNPTTRPVHGTTEFEPRAFGGTH